MEQSVVAIVQDVVNGKHGTYVVTTSKEVEGSITFSLGKEVWREDKHPEEGDRVVLLRVYQKRGGWRALEARFFGLKDGQH